MNGANKMIARARKGSKIISDNVEISYKAVTADSHEIAVNVGSNADFIDAQRRVWLADQAYVTGGWGFFGDRSKFIYSAPPNRNVLETDSDPLYQTMQEGLQGYKFDVSDGHYR